MPMCLLYVLSFPHSQTPMNVTMGLISSSRSFHELNHIIMFFGGRGSEGNGCGQPTGQISFEIHPHCCTRHQFICSDPHGYNMIYLHIPVGCTRVSGLGAITDEATVNDHAQVVLWMVWSPLVNTQVGKSYSRYMFGFPGEMQHLTSPTAVWESYSCTLPNLHLWWMGRVLTLAFPWGDDTVILFLICMSLVIRTMGSIPICHLPQRYLFKYYDLILNCTSRVFSHYCGDPRVILFICAA